MIFILCPVGECVSSSLHIISVGKVSLFFLFGKILTLSTLCFMLVAMGGCPCPLLALFWRYNKLLFGRVWGIAGTYQHALHHPPLSLLLGVESCDHTVINGHDLDTHKQVVSHISLCTGMENIFICLSYHLGLCCIGASPSFSVFPILCALLACLWCFSSILPFQQSQFFPWRCGL